MVKEGKLLEFNPEEIKNGECKFIDTEAGSFEVCRKNNIIEIYEAEIRL